jgi:hypothetical protein
MNDKQWACARKFSLSASSPPVPAQAISGDALGALLSAALAFEPWFGKVKWWILGLDQRHPWHLALLVNNEQTANETTMPSTRVNGSPSGAKPTKRESRDSFPLCEPLAK